MTLDVDKEFLEQKGLEFVENIGSGGYGSVSLVYSTQYKMQFALKKMHKRNEEDTEVQMLSALDCPNIVRLYKYFYFKGYLYLLMEYCPKSFNNFIREKRVFSRDQIIMYMKDALMAISYCHQKNISHGDIKPSNFLLDQNGRLKLCDFGLAMENWQESHSFCGSPLFMAPELFRHEPYDSFKADVWSFGVSFYWIITKTSPWRGTSKAAILNSICNSSIDFTKIHDFEIAKVLHACLRRDPYSRPSVEELLKLPIFQHSLGNLRLRESSRKRPNRLIVPLLKKDRQSISAFTSRY